MKLNYKNTLLIGLAFMAICAFWQMYDNIIPLLLTNTFHLNETISGAVMAADNVLAIFLLPLFGRLSDRTNTKLGKRMPYILVGTVLSVIFLNLLPIIDNGYAFGSSASFYSLKFFIIILGCLLFSMSIFRSPAVALMPDVTPKPLRSKGNAVINLAGAAGGIIYLIYAAVMFPKSKTEGVEHVNYQPLFVFITILMVVALIVMLITVRENKLAEANNEIEKQHPEWDLSSDDEANGSSSLPKPVFKSMIFLLVSIALWFISYNGVTTWFTTYVSKIMGEGIGGASLCFMIASGGAIVSYIPLGQLASKIGRKKSIQIGTILLGLSFGICFVLTNVFSSINVVFYIDFVLIGFAWAAINVNSLPMCVEMCKGSDVGKFTGYYYTASMIGQVLTPILAGTLMRNISYQVLFPYAMIFAFLSFVTMLFVNHGDVKAEAIKGLEAFEDMD